jgi:hypothetical protein
LLQGCVMPLRALQQRGGGNGEGTKCPWAEVQVLQLLGEVTNAARAIGKKTKKQRQQQRTMEWNGWRGMEGTATNRTERHGRSWIVMRVLFTTFRYFGYTD